MKQELFAYKIVNLIIAGVIGCIFLYSGIFSFERNNFPVHSFHDTVVQNNSLSSGLSRSFSAIMRFDFQQAKIFNRYGISIFAFFLIQFFLRLIFFVVAKRQIFPTKHIVIIDAILSASLFILHFKPFLIDIFNFR